MCLLGCLPGRPKNKNNNNNNNSNNSNTQDNVTVHPVRTMNVGQRQVAAEPSDQANQPGL